jgi:tetratricopeptide (TPR) repeat protein
MRTLAAACLAFALALGAGMRARAAPEADDETDQSRAGAHFERGVEFYREGSLDAALVEFERAYELIPSVRLLFNLGQIQAERHDYAAALSLFERYTGSDDPEIPEARRADAQHEIVRLRARVAYLSVTSDVAGAQLFIDDVPVALLPLSEPLAINPGVCNVRLEKSGYRPVLSALKVAAGEQPALHLGMLAGSGAADSSSPNTTGANRVEPAAAGRATYTPFWITTATTVALGGAALGLGLTAREADRELSAQLARVPSDAAQVEDARSQLKLYSALTDTCAALAVVGLGLSIYFLVKPLRVQDSSSSASARRTLQVFPGHRGLALRATF